MEQEINNMGNHTHDHNLTSPVINQAQTLLPELLDGAKNCVIWDSESYNKAADLTKFINETLKSLEVERKRITAPLNDSLKAANSLFKRFSDPLDQALISVKGKILQYKRAEEDRIRKEQEEIRLQKEKEAEELRQRAIKENAPELLMQPVEIVAAAPVQDLKARGDFGTVTTQKRWTFEVVNELDVPRDYLCVDRNLVLCAIKAGTREINGIKIYQTESAVIR